MSPGKQPRDVLHVPAETAEREPRLGEHDVSASTAERPRCFIRDTGAAVLRPPCREPRSTAHRGSQTRDASIR